MGLSPRRAVVLGTRRRTRCVVGLLLLVAMALAFDGWQLWRADRDNAVIASRAPIAAAPELTPELRFARAYAQAASEPGEKALNAYRSLHDEPRLGPAARFNSANLLLRQAVEVRKGKEPGQAIALIELGKEMYRDLLREQPQNWDARYNLERAQRLLPDPEEADYEPPEAAHNRERAATTMRGYSPGLP
jgi:mxaK protein